MQVAEVDKLTNPERRRLEALAQAILAGHFTQGVETVEKILDRAQKFDRWLKDGEIDPRNRPN